MLYYLTFRANKVNKPWGTSTVGRTKFSEVHPTSKAVNGESAQNSPGIFGALAQLVARYIRIVEVSGSNPLCSTTRKTLDSIRILGSFFIFLYNRFSGVDSRFDSNQLFSRVLMGQKARCFFVPENPPKKAKKSKKLTIAEKRPPKKLLKRFRILRKSPFYAGLQEVRH